MRYAEAKWRQRQIDEAYRIYITDSLFAIGQQKGLVSRYYDLIQPRVVDNRDGNEIASDVIHRLGLKVQN